MKLRKTPDGQTLGFPDSMTDDQILAVMRQNFPRQDSAAARFSQGGVAIGASLLDRLASQQNQLLGDFAVPESQRAVPLLERATEAGITSPEALTRGDLPTTAGRYAVGSLLGAVARPAVAGAELLSGAGGAVGEFAGRQIGGDVGALVGGIAGSISPSALTPGIKSVFGGPSGAQANFAARQALEGAPIGLGEIGGSPLSRVLERITATMPGGGTLSRGRATRIALKASQKATQVRDSMAGLRAVTPESGGRNLRQGFGDFIEQWNKKSGVLYGTLAQKTGGTQTQPSAYAAAVRMLGGEASSNTEVARGFGKGAAELIEDATTRLQNHLAKSPNMSMAQMDTIRRRIGSDLSDVKNVIGTPQEGVLKTLYKAITKDMRRLAQNTGSLRDFERASRHWDAGLKRIKALNSEVINRGTDSKILQALETSVRGGPETVRALRRSLSKEHWDAARRVVFRRMGQDTASAGEAIDLMADVPEFELHRFLNNWRRYAQNGGIKELFAGASRADKAAARNMTQIAKVAVGSRALVKSLPNPSNTAERLVTTGTAAVAMGSVLTPFALEAITLAGMSAGAASGIQLMLSSPKFIGWLAQSTALPMGQLPQHLERLARVVEDEPSSKPMAEYILDQFDQN